MLTYSIWPSQPFRIRDAEARQGWRRRDEPFAKLRDSRPQRSRLSGCLPCVCHAVAFWVAERKRLLAIVDTEQERSTSGTHTSADGQQKWALFASKV
jgi:hypothetical protein